MLLQKNEYKKLSAAYLTSDEKGVLIKHGDIVKITGDIEEQPSRFNIKELEKYIKVKTSAGDRMVKLNQDSINILIDEFHSNNSTDWVGKTVKALINKTAIGGQKVKVLYLVGTDWELDDYGKPIIPGDQPGQAEEIPTIEVGEDEVKIEDVPF